MLDLLFYELVLLGWLAERVAAQGKHTKEEFLFQDGFEWFESTDLVLAQVQQCKFADTFQVLHSRNQIPTEHELP